jgi:hypothetical protein
LDAFASSETGPITIIVEGNGQLNSSGDGVDISNVSYFVVAGTQMTLTVRNNIGRGFNVFGLARIVCGSTTTVTNTGNGVTDFIENGSCGGE